MSNQEYEEEEEEEIDLDSIEDEQTLIQLLDDTEDIDERKRIRDRLRKVQFEIKAQREERRRELENAREVKIQKRLKEANENKQKTLAMYAEMAKQGGPPGSKRNTDPQSPGVVKPRDVMEESIRDRLRRSDERKQRILAAYDDAAKNQSAGGARIVEFDAFKKTDVSKLEAPKTVKGSCCFSMSGGVPKVEKVAVSAPKPAAANDESHLDPMERAIRARVREADERKRRTLAAYDVVARSGGAGPKVVIMEEFRNLEVDPEAKKGPRYDPCFRGVKT